MFLRVDLELGIDRSCCIPDTAPLLYYSPVCRNAELEAHSTILRLGFRDTQNEDFEKDQWLEAVLFSGSLLSSQRLLYAGLSESNDGNPFEVEVTSSLEPTSSGYQTFIRRRLSRTDVDPSRVR